MKVKNKGVVKVQDAGGAWFYCRNRPGLLTRLTSPGSDAGYGDERYQQRFLGSSSKVFHLRVSLISASSIALGTSVRWWRLGCKYDVLVADKGYLERYTPTYASEDYTAITKVPASFSGSTRFSCDDVAILSIALKRVLSLAVEVRCWCRHRRDWLQPHSTNNWHSQTQLLLTQAAKLTNTEDALHRSGVEQLWLWYEISGLARNTTEFKWGRRTAHLTCTR